MNAQHLTVAPILLPLVAAALMLLLGESRRRAKAVLGVASCTLGLLVALALLVRVDAADAAQAFIVYLPANWEVPFGIVLVVDRLSALMLVLGALIGLASVLYSLARWHRAGVHFHPLLQMQLMGLNGAFLTGDLFNLFVFFEVMLAASYGLLLHGPNAARVRAGLHYVAINLVASLFFLIGVAVLYGVTGTLNMADIAQKLPRVPEADRGLMHAGAAVLAVAFLIKAALWPLNFWLPPAYRAASAPVAALFALLTKVGVYALLRCWTLFFPATGGAPPFGADALVWGGLATLAFGAIAMLASMHLSRLAGYGIVVSSGTLLAAIGFGNAPLTAGALYYLAGSTLGASALFLLAELIERARAIDVDAPLPDAGDGLPAFALEPPAPMPLAELDLHETTPIGRAIPAALAFLGLGFVMCALLIAGLPPLSGFAAKFTMLSALLAAPAGAAPPTPAQWTLFALLIGSGLLSTIALSRAGIRHFWAPQERPPPRLRVIECLPLALLLLACVWLVLRADVALRYARAAADVLHRPQLYIGAVMSARPVPAPETRP